MIDVRLQRPIQNNCCLNGGGLGILLQPFPHSTTSHGLRGVNVDRAPLHRGLVNFSLGLLDSFLGEDALQTNQEEAVAPLTSPDP